MKNTRDKRLEKKTRNKDLTVKRGSTDTRLLEIHKQVEKRINGGLMHAPRRLQENHSLAKKASDLLGLPRAMSVAACVMDWARVLIQFYRKKFLLEKVGRCEEVKEIFTNGQISSLTP